MGVKDFTKVFKATRTVTFKDLANTNLAVDAFVELFRSTSMGYAAKLTNPAGESTIHLKVTLSNAIKRLSLDCKDVWVFDSRDPRRADDPKQRVIADRAAIRKKNVDEIERLHAEINKLEESAKKVSRAQLLVLDPTFEATLNAKREQFDMLRARNPDAPHFSNMIRDVQFILAKLGISCITAPAGVDAEGLSAFLSRAGIVSGVISTDADTMAYGATRQYKKRMGKGESGKYDEYVLTDCLAQYGIKYPELVAICTALGTDDCVKTPGVGPATVVQKLRAGKITFTDEQRAAQKKFMEHSDIAYELVESVRTNEGLNELKIWLVKVQGFNAEKLDKTLSGLYL